MARKLDLQTPLVFEPSAPLFVRRLAFLAILAPGIFFGSMAMSSYTGIVLIVLLTGTSLLSIVGCLVAFDGIEGKITVDADGIEWNSPLKKKRLLWNDGLQLLIKDSSFSRASFRTYYVIFEGTKIAFGENLKNLRYLLLLIDAGINGRADKHSVVALPLAPLDTANKDTVTSMIVGAVLLLSGAFICGFLTFEEAKFLHLTPTVHIRDVAQYAGKDIEIRVNGKLHTEPPVVARDGQHEYAFQYVRLSNPDGEVTSVVTPYDIVISEGTDKLNVKALYLYPNYFGMPAETTFQKNWQKTDVGKMVVADADEHFKEYEKALPNEDHRILVWNVPKDQPVTIVGRVKSENDALILQPTEGSRFWLTPNPNKQLEQDFLFKAIPMFAAAAIGIYLIIAAFLEAQKGYQDPNPL